MLYWNLAIGLTLGGQGTLIFGLVLVVSRLWRNSRYATGKLQDVHARLGQLQHTADALTAMRSGGAPAFYADLVRGASPQVLLANLKGQLDQLASRIGNGSDCERRRLGADHASTRCAISSTTSALFTRHCSSESRSRIVTVPSCSVWPSTVMQNGVPASSWRR